jgi:hypothetical protein
LSNAIEYKFFSTPHRTFSKIDDMLGNKQVLTHTKNQIISYILYHNRIKINSKRTETIQPHGDWKISFQWTVSHWTNQKGNFKNVKIKWNETW